MNDIEADRSECRERAWKVLQKWEGKNGNGATLGMLLNAFHVIGRKDVVQELLDV